MCVFACICIRILVLVHPHVRVCLRNAHAHEQGAVSSPIQRVVVDYSSEAAFVSPGLTPEAIATHRRAWRTIAGPALAKQLASGGGKFLWGGRFTAVDVFAGIPLLFLHVRFSCVCFCAFSLII